MNEIYLLIYFLSPCAGLSEAEINLAVAKAKEINPALGMQVAHAPPTYASAPPLPVREVQVVHKRGWKDYTLAAVIIAGVSYVIVVFIKVSMECKRSTMYIVKPLEPNFLSIAQHSLYSPTFSL